MTPEELRAAITDAEAALMRHAPDPRTGLCPTDGVHYCPAYAPAARQLGKLRNLRDFPGHPSEAAEEETAV